MEQLEGRGNAREMDGNTLPIMAPQRYRSFLLQPLLILLLLTFIRVSLISMPQQVIAVRVLHDVSIISTGGIHRESSAKFSVEILN